MFSNTLASINLFALCVHQILFYSPFHSPKQLPQLGLSASPLKLFGIVCHMQSEKRLHNLNFCADSRDASLVDHGYPAPHYRCSDVQRIYGAEQTNLLLDVGWRASTCNMHKQRKHHLPVHLIHPLLTAHSNFLFVMGLILFLVDMLFSFVTGVTF